MRKAKDKSLAKSMVMVPLYRSRVERNAKAFTRHEKHRKSEGDE